MHEANLRVGDRAEAVLANAPRCALYIDIDGTLLGVAPTPDAVSVPAGLVALIDSVRRGLGGAVAVLTGRRIADCDRLFAPLELVASGVHGTEMRSQAGSEIAMLAAPIPKSVVEAMTDIAHIAPGVLVEQKGSGVAIHYRNAPFARAALETELAAIVAASPYALALRQGRKVIEAVPSGYSKGTALTHIASLPPFAGRLPVMIGDDVGDESAFMAAESLGGVALRVAGEHFSAEAADFDSVRSVRAWLEALAARLSSQTATERF